MARRKINNHKVVPSIVICIGHTKLKAPNMTTASKIMDAVSKCTPLDYASNYGSDGYTYIEDPEEVECSLSTNVKVANIEKPKELLGLPAPE